MGLIPNNPSLAQRALISDIIRACDTYITDNPEFIKKMNSGIFNIPLPIMGLIQNLISIDSNPANMNAIFNEIMRFVFDVNHKFIENSLKI